MVLIAASTVLFTIGGFEVTAGITGGIFTFVGGLIGVAHQRRQRNRERMKQVWRNQFNGSGGPPHHGPEWEPTIHAAEIGHDCYEHSKDHDQSDD